MKGISFFAWALTLSLVVTPAVYAGKKDKCDVTRQKLAGKDVKPRGLTLSDVMQIRKDAERNTGDYRAAYRRYGIDHGRSITIDGRELKLEKSLGEGYRAQVYRASNGNAIKIPHDASDCFALEVEAQINDHLDANYKTYKIKTLPIVSRGERGAYLEKPMLDKDQIASNILRKRNLLLPQQKEKLKALWEHAKEYAEDTGIGLDLKAANLYWNGEDWVLFDAGPRTSYVPYGFTLDPKNFEEYLEIWNDDEPPEGGLSLDGMMKRLGRK